VTFVTPTVTGLTAAAFTELLSFQEQDGSEEAIAIAHPRPKTKQSDLTIPAPLGLFDFFICNPSRSHHGQTFLSMSSRNFSREKSGELHSSITLRSFSMILAVTTGSCAAMDWNNESSRSRRSPTLVAGLGEGNGW